MQNIFLSLHVLLYTYFVLQNVFKWEIYFQNKKPKKYYKIKAGLILKYQNKF